MDSATEAAPDLLRWSVWYPPGHDCPYRDGAKAEMKRLLRAAEAAPRDRS